MHPDLRAAVVSLGIALTLAIPGPAAAQVTIGHRGGWHLPENTLVNYDFALDAGTEVIEIDVWESLDGVPVCHHDLDLHRTTDGTGPIVDKTLAELKTLDAGSWLDPIYAGERIPTLEEALTLIDGRGRVLLDIKDEAFIPSIVAAIDAAGFPREDVSVWIRTFGANLITPVLPEAEILRGIGPPRFSEAKFHQSAVEGHQGLILDWAQADPAYIALAHDYGLVFYAKFVSPNDFTTALALGLDGLVVTRPDLLAPLVSGTASECGDGIDNDADGQTDHPADPGCFGPDDPTEAAACSDGIDNDADGYTDHPADPGCFATFSSLEDPACDDGIDNNGDTWIDHPDDPGCFEPFVQIEGVACLNGIDEDLDGAIDYPADSGCTSADDPSEEPDCSDALDNDQDGVSDWPADPACFEPDGDDEREACRNGVDDDLDGLTDFPDDPHCEDDAHLSEHPDCSDGFDNDADGDIDFPGDIDCNDAADPSENTSCNDGIDNDADGAIDFPADVGCGTAADRWETDDNDADGLADRDDNCFDVPNVDQCDTNLDGIGNACDADFNDDGIVGIADFSHFRNHHPAVAGDPDYDADVDSNCDGVTGIPDFNALRTSFGRAPGGSGLSCAGSPPCNP
jgi:glycerophosphoryl diester phosphodiesterase